MVQTITYLSTDKFVAAGIFARKNLEYVINDFVFVKKCSIEICSSEKVLNICKKYSKLNHYLITNQYEDKEHSSKSKLKRGN